MMMNKLLIKDVFTIDIVTYLDEFHVFFSCVCSTHGLELCQVEVEKIVLRFMHYLQEWASHLT